MSKISIDTLRSRGYHQGERQDTHCMKILSLNIEGSKHLTRWIPFVKKHAPDVLCLQEVFARDLDEIAGDLSMKYGFMPTMRVAADFDPKSTSIEDWGIAMFYHELPVDVELLYYTQDISRDGEVPVWTGEVGDIWKQAVILATWSSGITVANTHLAWTANGQSTEYQRTYAKDLLKALEQKEHIVLCGDLNAPRGGETWNIFAHHYVDNIPSFVETTIDQNLHKVKGLQYVVDGLFSSPTLRFSDVGVVDGLSDHMAVLATLTYPMHMLGHSPHKK